MEDYREIIKLTNVDTETFATRAMNDISFMKELVDIGKTNAVNYLSGMSKSIEENDSERFHDLAHTLKGNADLLGMNNIGQTLRVWIDNTNNNETPILSEFQILNDAMFKCFDLLEEFVKSKE